MQINQLIILGTLVKYPNGIPAKKLLVKLQSIYPELFRSLNGFYISIRQLEGLNFIKGEFSRSIPRFKTLKITDSGAEAFFTYFKPLQLLHDPKFLDDDPTRKNGEEYWNQDEQTGWILDKAEQMDLILAVQYQILNYSGEEMEQIEEKRAERLNSTAVKMLQDIFKLLDVKMEQ